MLILSPVRKEMFLIAYEVLIGVGEIEMTDPQNDEVKDILP